MAFSKTQCPISRETFRVAAKPMTVTFTDHAGKQQSFPLVVKEFSTGSLGWNLSGKTLRKEVYRLALEAHAENQSLVKTFNL